jgi:hypothetical protein
MRPRPHEIVAAVTTLAGGPSKPKSFLVRSGSTSPVRGQLPASGGSVRAGSKSRLSSEAKGEQPLGSFDDVIQEHLDLKRRNSHLEASLPLANYQLEAAFVTDRPQGVFDAAAEVEGAAFNTAEWKGDQCSDGSRGRRKSETFLESLEDVSSALEFDWDKKR